MRHWQPSRSPESITWTTQGCVVHCYSLFLSFSKTPPLSFFLSIPLSLSLSLLLFSSLSLCLSVSFFLSPPSVCFSLTLSHTHSLSRSWSLCSLPPSLSLSLSLSLFPLSLSPNFLLKNRTVHHQVNGHHPWKTSMHTSLWSSDKLLAFARWLTDHEVHMKLFFLNLLWRLNLSLGKRRVFPVSSSTPFCSDLAFL